MCEIAFAKRDAFDKRKNEVQYQVNQVLFSKTFEYDAALDAVALAHQPLAQDDIHVRLLHKRQLEQTDDPELTIMFAIARDSEYDGQFNPLVAPDDLQKVCDVERNLYYAVYELGQFHALLKISGTNMRQRFEREEMARYFAGTAAKLSYRLSDFSRMSHLNVADQVINRAREAIVITDPAGNIVRVNKSFTRITGYTEAEAIGNTPRVLKSGMQTEKFYQKLWQQLIEDGYWFGEFINRTKDGKIYNQRGSISAIHTEDGELLYYAAMMEDVTELKLSEANLNRLNYFDELTGLPNRNKLSHDCAEFLKSDVAAKHELAVLVIDLDDFKHVNDAMGHRFGDELLRAVAERLSNCVGQTGTVYRFGGDEFVVLTKYHERGTQELVEDLIERMKVSFEVRFNPILISCSIGIALSGQDGDNLEQLLSRADLAMYSAKESGRARFAFSSDELHRKAFNNLLLKSELQHALATQQMNLVYQPKRCIAQDTIVGCEALVRWEHPQHGAVSPAEFIPIAERSGMIVEIDYWVMEAAMQQLARWRQQGLSLVPVAVNVSLPTFSHDGFVEDVQALLQRYDLCGELLELEITERVALGNVVTTAEVMRRLIELGIHISMDDFGTGYSSLSYLNQLPISTLKIDRAFVSNIEHEPLKQGITGAIVAMAKAMKLKTVAEGVETEAELNYLAQLGCDQLQGFYYSRPLAPAMFTRWLAPRELN
ncbi:putative bifunctional diguanylate cyclase/phosphodiesterase [Shewanella mangrovi]|uniref:putative bifunctional diguanylate cyclase/phosphodiesterase n=1 Tax=Shewanella mangrovi TaxID=1515746 RepID=UPI00068A7894|nr:EAL domain-containing protein [Shewanella mangrovi]